MSGQLFSRVLGFVTQGHERSVKAKKNILASVLLKGIGIGTTLLLVPMTIEYVNPTRYGVWITISSIVAWLSFFDIGLTQGLRNRFAEARARGDDQLAQVYVSTTYVLLALFFATLWILFMGVNQFLDWSRILNVEPEMKQDVGELAVIVFSYFCIQFVLRVITTIVTADQQPAKASLIEVSGQVLSLLSIFILVRTTQGSLVKLGLALCLAPLTVLVLSNLILFSKSYRPYRPTLSKVRFRLSGDLLGLGIKFFVIQIAAIIQFQTASFLIAQFFGPLEVTNYNIVYKYFGVLLIVFNIAITPFWSASTEAYEKKEIQWIRNGMKRYTQLFFVMLAGGILMLLLSGQVYTLWLGKGTVDIAFILSFWGLMFFAANMFGLKYVSFLNGINALRIQFYSSLISPALFIGLTFLLIKVFHMGVYALFIASFVANFNGLILAPLQYYQVIYKGKQGIWTAK